MEQDLDRELSFHVDMLTEQHVRAGMPPDEARRIALNTFGGIERVKDDVRETWLSRVLETLAQDIRYGLRNLRRDPGFALVVVATTALGIGANTAIFSVVNGVLLRPLPYANGDRIVVLRQQQPLANVDDTGFSAHEIEDYREQARSLDGVVEFHNMWFILLGRPEPERVATGVVSWNYFDVFGVQPAFGRTFQAADEKPGAPAVLILSNKYWQRSFGGDPSVVGRIFQMNDRPHQVVGILPPVPQYPLDLDVYMPTTACPFRSTPAFIDNRTARMMQAFGRLKPGVTIEKARADLSVVAAGLQSAHPDVYRVTDGYQMAAIPLGEQVAASFMLLIGAGLTLRTVVNLQRVDPGFKTDSLLTMRIDLNFSKYKGDQVIAFWERLEDRLRAVPGVTTVAGGGTFPLNDQGPFSGPLQIESRDLPPNAPRPQVDFHLATPDYFATIGQPLLSGRTFTRSDRGKTDHPVVIINKTMARHYWPSEDPVGKRINGGGPTWFTIVGVVADTLQRLNEPAHDEVYRPMLQSGQLSTTWLVRTSIDPHTMERQVRDAVRAVDPEQPVDHFRTMAEVRSAWMESPKLTAMLLGLFALLALVITAAGIAGVVAFSVNQRTQEFGIRMALGAQRASVLSMVLRQGVTLVLVGLVIGMAGALVLTRLLTTLLFGVEPTDALTFLAVSMVLVAVAAAACLIPARRAASVDPMVALRVY